TRKRGGGGSSRPPSWASEAVGRLLLGAYGERRSPSPRLAPNGFAGGLMNRHSHLGSRPEAVRHPHTKRQFTRPIRTPEQLRRHARPALSAAAAVAAAAPLAVQLATACILGTAYHAAPASGLHSLRLTSAGTSQSRRSQPVDPPQSAAAASSAPPQQRSNVSSLGP